MHDNNSSIEMNIAGISTEFMECKLRPVLHKIKTHTSNKNSGITVAKISMDLRIMKRNLTTNVPVTIDECTHLELDSNFNDHERGDTNYFFAVKFGKIKVLIIW